jgi:L-amino acid N-acyltransferase YncA
MFKDIALKLKGQLRRFIDFKKIYEVPMSTLQRLPPKTEFELKFKLANINDILAFDSLALAYDKSSFSLSKEWLKEGKMMLVGYHEDEPVIYGWISKTELDLSLGEVRKLPMHTLYVFKIFIHRQYRGKGLLTSYYRCLADYFKNDGDNIVIWVADSNIPSIKSHLKIGFHAKGSYVTIRLGSKLLSFFFDKTANHFKQ